MGITAQQAKSFWNDLMGTLNFSTKGTHGIMSTSHIAEYLGIETDIAEKYLRRCLKDDLQLTDRQGGGWVV